ncbi:MAG: hypothetical protein HZA08_10185 [Nitrospirae bacterium]|nr:hypothetical protein [Nitrospirota bacterium]
MGNTKNYIYVIKNFFEKEGLPWGLKPPHITSAVGKLCLNLSTGEKAIPLTVSDEDDDEASDVYLDSGECKYLKTGSYNISVKNAIVNCGQVEIKRGQTNDIVLNCDMANPPLPVPAF